MGVELKNPRFPPFSANRAYREKARLRAPATPRERCPLCAVDSLGISDKPYDKCLPVIVLHSF